MAALFGTGQGRPIATQATRANGIQLQASNYGKGLPIVYGRNRLQGNLMWYGDFQSVEHSQQVGKGGGGNTSTSYTYSSSFMLAICEGPVRSLGTIWKDSGTVSLSDINGTFKTGTSGQSAWSHLAGAEALGYTDTAWIGCENLKLGSTPTVPNFNFEIYGLLPFNAGTIEDAEPSVIINDLMTSTTHGIGFDALGDLTSYKDYCTAKSVFLSPVIDQEQAMMDLLKNLLLITNTTVFWTGGKLKFLPWSDESATGNGLTYTPATTSRASIDSGNDTKDGISIERKPLADLHNTVKVEYVDSTNNYVTAVAEAKDQSDIDSRGVRSTDTITAHSITGADLASAVAQRILQRDLYIRNTYRLDVTMEYFYLEPGDVIALTDDLLGLSSEPVRITQIDESDSDDWLTLTCEEFPAGVSEGAQYATEALSGYTPDSAAAPDTSATPVIFRAPQALAASETWVGVAGTGADWGGAHVWVSFDNATYSKIGTVMPGCRYGTLTEALAVGTDPDTTNSFKVQLSGPGELNGGTATDADNAQTLMLVDSELISYESTTLNTDGTYTLGGDRLRRGLYGTAIAAHAIGAPWLRVDDHFFRWTFDSGLAGTSIYIKLTAFNLYGGGEESLASVSAISYVVGTAEEIPDTVAAPSLSVTPVADGVNLSFSYAVQAAVLVSEVQYSTDGTTWSHLAYTNATTFPHHFGTGATYYYRVRGKSFTRVWGGFSSTISSTGKTVADGATVGATSGTNLYASDGTTVLSLSDYVTAVTHTSDINNLQSQIDGQIVSWFYEYDPTTSNVPASDWTTTTLKDQHLGDTFTNQWDGSSGSGSGTAGASWRWAKISGVYQWQVIPDTIYTKALADAANAQDTADHKRRVFVATPTVPYDVGDLWDDGDTKIYRCNTAKVAGGSYALADWTLIADLTSTATSADTSKVNAVDAKVISAGAIQSVLWDMSTLPPGVSAGGAIISGSGVTGGSVLQCTNYVSWDRDYSTQVPLYPFDDGKLYRIRCRMRVTTDGSTQQPQYIGIGTFDNAGASIGTNSGNLYLAAHNVLPSVSSGWVVYEGWFSGTASANAINSATPADPAKCITGTAYFAPLILANYYTNVGQVAEYDFYSIEVFDASAQSRVYNAIDSGGVIVDTAFDFSRGYTNKSLANVDPTANTKLGTIATGAQVNTVNAGDSITAFTGRDLSNIGDYAAGNRYAVYSVDGNRRPYIDFTQSGHVGKSLANVDPTANTKLSGINANANGHYTKGNPGGKLWHADSSGAWGLSDTFQLEADLYNEAGTLVGYSRYTGTKASGSGSVSVSHDTDSLNTGYSVAGTIIANNTVDAAVDVVFTLPNGATKHFRLTWSSIDPSTVGGVPTSGGSK